MGAHQPRNGKQPWGGGPRMTGEAGLLSSKPAGGRGYATPPEPQGAVAGASSEAGWTEAR